MTVKELWNIIKRVIALVKKKEKYETHGDTICQICGNKNPTWYAGNELFNKINGSPNGILCPKCFQDKANEKNISIIFKAEI